MVVTVAICTFSTILRLSQHLLFRSLGLITIILVLVMISTVFFNFKQRAEVLVVPVATLFAFTQLRASLPGAPAGFGTSIFFSDSFQNILTCFR